MTVLRPLTVGDIETVQAIDRQAHGEAWSRATFVDQLRGAHFHHIVSVDDADTPVAHGATWSDGHTLRLTNLACASSVAGRGHATSLLLELFSDLPPVDRLALEVRPSNRRAQRLYSRFGFSPVGVAREFYPTADPTGSRDALVMQVGEPHGHEWQSRLALMRRTKQHLQGVQA